MKDKTRKSDTLKEKQIKRDLLSFVMGGEDLSLRCARTVYADSIYVKPNPPIIVHPL